MTPRDVFALMREQWLANTPLNADLLTDDVVVEMPFAATGRPNRIEGRQRFMMFAEAGRAALPVHFDDCRNIVIHETTDPNVIIVEYELVGTVTTTGVSAAAPFIGVLKVRDGQIAHWREYQNTSAIAQALQQQ